MGFIYQYIQIPAWLFEHHSENFDPIKTHLLPHSEIQYIVVCIYSSLKINAEILIMNEIKRIEPAVINDVFVHLKYVSQLNFI